MATDSPKIHCDTILPTLVVPDVKATAEFYMEKLGFKLQFFWGEPPTHTQVADFQRNDPRIFQTIRQDEASFT